MEINWARLIATLLGVYFVGIGVFAVFRQRVPISMTRGFRTSIEWRTGRTAVLLGAWCLALGIGFLLYAWAR